MGARVVTESERSSYIIGITNYIIYVICIRSSSDLDCDGDSVFHISFYDGYIGISSVKMCIFQ